MTREALKEILPHREPMLLLDEATKIEDNLAEGKYTVRGDEWFLQAHFPGNPVVPGVIQCEMMAQTCCVLLVEAVKGHTPLYTGLDKVRFKGQVKPGDTIVFHCSATGQRGPFCFAKGEGRVNGKLVVKGDLSFAIV